MKTYGAPAVIIYKSEHSEWVLIVSVTGIQLTSDYCKRLYFDGPKIWQFAYLAQFGTLYFTVYQVKEISLYC